MDGSFFVPAVVKFHGPCPADIGVCSIDKKSIAGPRLPPGEDNTRDTTQPTSYRRHVLPDEVSTVHASVQTVTRNCGKARGGWNHAGCRKRRVSTDGTKKVDVGWM